MRIPKFIRIAPPALTERDADGDSMITGPADFVAALKPHYGVVVASWDESAQLGMASRLGVVLRQTSMRAVVKWMPADLQYRPSPSGRRFWGQAEPFFAFAADVAERYLLARRSRNTFVSWEARMLQRPTVSLRRRVPPAARLADMCIWCALPTELRSARA